MTWIAGALALLLLVFVTLYCISLKESRHLVCLVLLILVDEEAYARHRLWLAELVRSIDTDGAPKLNFRVWRALKDFAATLNGPATSLYTAKRLWTLKQRQQS